MDHKIKLFCFPYAGGSSAIFNNWKEHLSDFVELRAIELAGRGRRIGEPMYQTTEEGIADVFEVIKPEISQGPYAFFGHSMGAMIAYELAREIQLQGLEEPEHLFFSGRGAPHLKVQEEKRYHLLNDEDFKLKVLELGGTSPEVFEHAELLELFLPLLRNDFRLACTNFSEREISSFSSDISVFLGKKEEVTAQAADGWKTHTKGICSLYYFNGGHFFINKETARIVEKINGVLLKKRHSFH